MFLSNGDSTPTERKQPVGDGVSDQEFPLVTDFSAEHS